MAFVIRADDDGRLSWVTPPNEWGYPALSDRAGAAVFTTYEAAEAEVCRLAGPFGRIGVHLSIQEVD